MAEEIRIYKPEHCSVGEYTIAPNVDEYTHHITIPIEYRNLQEPEPNFLGQHVFYCVQSAKVEQREFRKEYYIGHDKKQYALWKRVK